MFGVVMVLSGGGVQEGDGAVQEVGDAVHNRK